MHNDGMLDGTTLERYKVVIVPSGAILEGTTAVAVVPRIAAGRPTIVGVGAAADAAAIDVEGRRGTYRGALPRA